MRSEEKSPGGNQGNRRGAASPYLYSKEKRGRTSNDGTPIYVGQTVVGYVENGTFRKTVKSSKHFLRRPRAIAFDVSTLHDAEAAGARRVEVTDSESGNVYQLPLSTVWAEGFEFDRGFGHQLGVRLDDWLRPGEQPVKQPSLFGEPA